MALHDTESIGGLIRSVLADTRELVREEMELMRAEVKEEVAQARAAGMAFGGAAFLGILGAAMLCVALATAVPYWLEWPVWTGFALVALLLLAVGYLAMAYGRKQLSEFRALPKTRATMKENLAWIQSKSAQK